MHDGATQESPQREAESPEFLIAESLLPNHQGHDEKAGKDQDGAQVKTHTETE